MPYPALSVANYFIHKAALEDGYVDPLKLQKLLYFANGWHLALYETPLIQEPIRAWKYGPVVDSVYHEFKRYGARSIDDPADGFALPPKSDVEVRDLLNSVWDLYGHYSGVQLSNLSHDPDGPWADRTRGGTSFGFGPRMENEAMRRYFKKLVEENDERAV